MKKLFFLLISIILLSSCKKEVKDYVTFNGKITNKNSDSLVVASRDYDYHKKITVNEDGTFSDTLKVKPGIFNVFDGKESTNVYLKNGAEIHMTLDTKQFDETVTYTGKGVDECNYLAKFYLLQEKELSDQSFLDLDKESFDKKTTAIVTNFKDLLSSAKNLDSAFSAEQTKQFEQLASYLKSSYEEKDYLKTVLGKGNVSPKFNGYENYKGGTTSLDDLKGKYVYIDVWATWCGPCKAEIPFLKEVEQAYHGKNIQFVSISVDQAKDHEAWKAMVKEKELGGIQLFADNDWKSQFVTDYKINGIPRFILIDPQGNIVSPDAPRPSAPELKTLLDELL